MRTKDKLCRKAVELENEIEFRTEEKLSVKKQKETLKKIKQTLTDLRDGDSITLYNAKALLETDETN